MTHDDVQSTNTTLPQVSYVAWSYSLCLIYNENNPLHSFSPLWDLVLAVDKVINPMRALEPVIPLVPSEHFDICSRWDDILPTNEAPLNGII